MTMFNCQRVVEICIESEHFFKMLKVVPMEKLNAAIGYLSTWSIASYNRVVIMQYGKEVELIAHFYKDQAQATRLALSGATANLVSTLRLHTKRPTGRLNVCLIGCT